jgi:hypothetical protein
LDVYGPLVSKYKPLPTVTIPPRAKETERPSKSFDFDDAEERLNEKTAGLDPNDPEERRAILKAHVEMFAEAAGLAALTHPYVADGGHERLRLSVVPGNSYQVRYPVWD